MDRQSDGVEYSPDTGGGVGKHSPLRSLERHLWRRIFSGFLVVVPILVTFFVFKIVYDYVESIFHPTVIY